MSSLRKSRRVRALTYILVAAMVLPLTPWAVGTACAQGDVRSVLLFKVVDESSSRLPELPRMATDALQMAIDAVPGLECTEFSRNSPLVRRAALEGRVLPAHVEAGVSGARDAVMIGHALGVDTVVLASAQSYRTKQNPRSVEIILSGQAYDVDSNYDAEAGGARVELAVAQAFGVVGQSRRVPGYRGSDRPLAREAIDDAAYRVAKVLSGASISEVAKPKPPAKKKSKIGKYLAIAVIVGGLAWAVSSSGGGGAAGPSPDAIPPTALPLQVEGTDTIRCKWNAPTGTSYTILRYHLQRSVNGGAWSFFGAGNSSANIDRTATEYPDFEVTAGNNYAYRIRVIYTNQKYSHWVMFAGVSL